MTEKYFNKVDPVCGMELILSTTVETAEFEGKTYGFCSKACKDLFVGDPKKYIDNPAPAEMMPQPKDIPEKPTIADPLLTGMTPKPKDNPDKD
jgi:YHS domain-containing protein